MDNFYITTTLPYVNGRPHLGHAIEFFQADAIARYNLLLGKEVLFNYGTDEYGLKIYKAAQEEGLDINEYVDKYARIFEDVKEDFNLSSNSFIRTTSERNIETSIEFWKRSEKKGDIYKKKYKGLYCVGCEAFKTEKDLIGGKCPDHDKEPIEVEEENYFFRFSKYEKELLDLFKKNPRFVIPESKHKEMVSFIKSGLDDFSISREKEKLPWGVPVPGDDSQVMYVWFEALTSYVAALGFPHDKEKFEKWWPAVQLCGPDNTRFQSLMWQAMLMSAGLEPSKQVLVHGTILNKGKKMSKSIGNVIDPYEIIEKFGLDGFRYFLFSEGPSTSDLDVNWDRIKEKYNSELANGVGNLVARTFTLAKKFEVAEIKFDPDFRYNAEFSKLFDTYKSRMEEYDFFGATKLIQDIISKLDDYLQETKPWEEKCDNREEVISNVIYSIKDIGIKLWPFIPETSEKILNYLGIKNIPNEISFEKEMKEFKFESTEKLAPLFPRIK